MPDLILGKAFRRCGNCNHTLPVKEDLQKRVCKGGPPALVPIPARGGFLMQSFWPVVQTNEAACRVWELKVDGEDTKGSV